MERLARLLFEIGHLKRVMRSGWWVAGVRAPESVAEHTFRCAWIAYFLAVEAGVDPQRAALMALVHDLHEARTNDHHKVSQAYLDPKGVEPRVFADQVEGIPTAEQLTALHAEYAAGESVLAQIVRDADRLECAFQAREYVQEGQTACRRWFENTAPTLRTDAGRALYAALAAAEPDAWFRSLPRVP